MISLKSVSLAKIWKRSEVQLQTVKVAVDGVIQINNGQFFINMNWEHDHSRVTFQEEDYQGAILAEVHTVSIYAICTLAFSIHIRVYANFIKP
jgi:hypothetical protein